jgi:LEA14-like dessication related protein
MKTSLRVLWFAALLLGGCGGGSSGPAVSLINLRFEDATAWETTATFTLRLSNELPEALQFNGEVHKIYLNGLYLGKGLVDEKVAVPRLGTVTREVQVHLSNLALATRIKSIIETKSFEYRIESVFYGKSWFSKTRSESSGKLELKDLIPETDTTNGPPASPKP